MKFKFLFFFAVLLPTILMCNSIKAAAAAGAGAGAESASEVSAKEVAQKNAQEKKSPYIFEYDQYATFDPIVFSPDGQWLSALRHMSGLYIFLVDPNTGKLDKVQNASTPVFYPDSLAVFPDGKTLALTDFNIGDIAVYNFYRHEKVRLYPINERGKKGGGHHIAISSNGPMLAAASHTSNEINFFSIDASNELQRYPAPLILNYRPNYLAISADGNFLAVTSPTQSVIEVFFINHNLKTLTKVQDSPLIEEIEKPEKYGSPILRPFFIAFSPHGNLLAAIYENDYIQLFHVDPQTGALTPAQKKIAFNNHLSLSSLAFSPNGRLLAAIGSYYRRGPVIIILSVDTQKGTIAFNTQMNTIDNAKSCAFSPDGKLFAVGGNGIAMYEVDYDSNALNPITGDTLRSIRKAEHKKAQEVLFESQDNNPPILPKSEAYKLLEEYIVGPKSLTKQQINQAKQNVQEDVQEKAITDAIAFTEKQRKTMRADADALFRAIQEGDAKAVTRYLTPFTINSRDNEGRTPLIAAAYHQKNNIVLQILEYKGIKQENHYHKTIEQADALARDLKGNTALLYAIVHKDNNLIDVLKKAMLKAMAEKKVQ